METKEIHEKLQSWILSTKLPNKEEYDKLLKQFEPQDQEEVTNYLLSYILGQKAAVDVQAKEFRDIVIKYTGLKTEVAESIEKILGHAQKLNDTHQTELRYNSLFDEELKHLVAIIRDV